MARSVTSVLFLFPFALAAQVNTASLTGLIKDQSGASVSGAKVIASSKSTGVEHQTKSDSSGYYFFPSLPIGEYTVSAEAAGFQRVNGAVTLETAQKGRQDFTLSVGAIQTTVAVESTIPQLSPQDASLGAVVDSSYVTQYPLLLRSWDDLLSTVAGVQGNRYTDQGGGTSFGRTGGFNVHGVRSLQNNFILDGIDNNSISENVQELTTQVVRPSVDSIQEFKITTNPYSAEYGRSPGAAINVTTKGGSNEVHGVLYEYLRNRVLDANDFFSNRNGLAKPQNIQNQFGGNIGAPIIKNKLFAFFDYEGTRIRRGVSRITTVPLANERIGDFSAAAAARAGVTYPTLYDFTTGQPFANNQIPANRLDPVALKLMALFPQPTLAGKQLNNFARNAGQLDDNDRYNGRVDFQPSSTDTVFGRYSFTTRDRFIPGNFGGIADGTSSSSQGRQHLTAHQIAAGWTRVVTPSLVNEFRVGFARNNSFAAQDPFGLNKVSDYIPGVPSDPTFDGGVSRITFASFNTFIGSPDFLPKFQVTQQYQFSDTVSYTRGKHQLKFGADFRAPLRNNFLDVPSTRGTLNFDRFFTCQRNAAGQCAANTGLSYADFLTGYVQTAQLSNLFVIDQRLHMYSFFGQDDFKVSPKLSLNLGIRYDFGTPAMEGRNRMANFNPAGAGSVVFAGSGSLEDRALVKPDRNNISPRFGLAYQINPATVLRTGYGIFYQLFDRIGSEDQLALNPPNLINNVASVAQTASAPVFLLRNGFPADYLDPRRLDLSRVRIRAANPQAPNTYVQQWSFGIQRTLPMRLFVEANYVGTKSTHLNTLRNYNQQLGGVLPYRNFGFIEYRDPLGNAVYHGLDLTLERRFSTGLTFRSAYTYSKSIDNTAEHLGTGGSSSFNQNGRDFQSWRGPSDFDYRHRWVTSYVYELPFGKGKPMVSSGILSYIVGGFRTSGGLTLATGRPFTVRASANNATIDPAGAHIALPNVVGTPVIVENVDCWFYSSRSNACRALAPGASDAFAAPPPGVFGNAGRNTLRGPGTAVFDFALHRDFKFAEKKALQFRWEVFNLANTTQFALPDTSISNTSAGAITALAGDARIMQFALRLSF
ncbi:MAG TPA: carboxypeptidase regulatory-like domain-containing protein [Bryobacteraceae bacterium]|nr:carboxypeptidase regulatory-like domain-containing protein [Bryobacteraceae bacterium]